MNVFFQVLQIVGALLVLSGFVLAQFRVLDVASYPYLLVNTVGSALLAVLALLGGQWGFLLLEGVWALVSAYGLARTMLACRWPTAH
ncbi:MAG: CBU_0592 family membrane protein [Streptosporangiaceae bacterium]